MNKVEESSSGPSEIREEISMFREMLCQTRTEMARLRRRIDQQQFEIDAHARHAKVNWVVTVLVATGLSAVLWYGFQAKEGSVVRLPQIQSLFSGIGARLSETNGEKTASTPVPENPGNQIPKDLGTGNDIASVPVPVEQVEPEVNSNGKSSSPAQALTSSNSGAQLLKDSVNRSRIDFVLPRNKTKEVAPGIFLTVHSTDMDTQQIDGYLQIAEDGRTVRIRDQSVQTVVTFATKRDARSRELVFTRIDKQGVAGYLLIPVAAG